MTTHVLDSIDPAAIGERLAEARRARGLTQQHVATELGVARTTITAMEGGERRPRAADLLRLAQLYGRQVGDFVRSQPERPSESFVVQFRAARGLSAVVPEGEREADIGRFQALCQAYVDLERLVEAPLPRRYPDPYDITDTPPERAAEEVATLERQRLGLGDGPIGDPWSLLETDVGLRIFAPPFASGRIAGMFVYTEEFGGCIAVNGNHPEEKRRWTLVHDYAHFLTTRYRPDLTVLGTARRVPPEERFADAFARFFLMPTAGLTRRFQALAWRLEELALLPNGTWERLKGLGFKPDKGRALADVPPLAPARGPLPLRYEVLAVQAYTRDLLTEGQLARYLETDHVGARRRIHELTVGTPYFDDGAWHQIALDLGAALIGPAR